MTEFVLVRHGETDWNVVNRLQGSTDIPLNERGIEQAKQAADALRNTVWDEIFASPLQRAFQTAVIIAQELGLDEAAITTYPELRERSYGLAEGLTLPERREKFPDDVWPEAELPHIMDERAGALMHELAEAHVGKRILVVAHGGWIRAALRVTSAFDPQVIHADIPNISRTYISHAGGRWVVGDVGDVDEAERAAPVD